MGKVKTKRFKYHRAANRAVEKSKEESQDAAMDEEVHTQPQPYQLTGLFDDVVIDPAKLSVKLDLNDNISVVSSKLDARHVPKKEKRRMRRDAFLKKLETAKATRKAQKRRKKVATSLNMGLLADALPTLDRMSLKSRELKEKPRASRSFRANQKLMLQDMKHIERVVRHPHFQEDPMEAILNHLRHTVQAEAETPK
uniref:Ribosome biogenesis protein SLX9 n=1 Tax=Ixodes ricinus TaxID=34613 RepID=A0A0K8RKX5_IXORI